MRVRAKTRPRRCSSTVKKRKDRVKRKRAQAADACNGDGEVRAPALGRERADWA
jgi:hypothetical protein